MHPFACPRGAASRLAARRLFTCADRQPRAGDIRALHSSTPAQLQQDSRFAAPSPEQVAAKLRATAAALTGLTKQVLDAHAVDLPTMRVSQRAAPHRGHVRVLTLNRPAASNAISRQFEADLRGVVEAVRREGGQGETRALVIASESEKFFCAGADLKERKGMTQEETMAFLKNVRQTFTQLSALPIPTISAISGYALGGGLELALCTHIRVLSSRAIVGLPETRLAIIPGAGGTYRLPAAVGTSRALELILTGRRIGADEARSYGLAHFTVDVAPDESAEFARDAALAKSVEIAMAIAEGGPVALSAAIEALKDGGSEDAEDRAYNKILPTKDRVEALAAFKERRKPVFTGE